MPPRIIDLASSSASSPSGSRRNISRMAPTRRQPGFVDLTQVDSDSDVDMDSHQPTVIDLDLIEDLRSHQPTVIDLDMVEAPHSHQSTVIHGKAPTPQVTSEVRNAQPDVPDNGGPCSSSGTTLHGVVLDEARMMSRQQREQPVLPGPHQSVPEPLQRLISTLEAGIAREKKSSSFMEPPVVPFRGQRFLQARSPPLRGEDDASKDPKELAKETNIASGSTKSVHASSEAFDDKNLKLIKRFIETVKKNKAEKEDLTFLADRNALVNVEDDNVAKTADMVMGSEHGTSNKMNNELVNLPLSTQSVQKKPTAKAKGKAPAKAPPSAPSKPRDTSYDHLNAWQVFDELVGINRCDFASGTDFLQACQKIRRRVRSEWNLQLDEQFVQVLFINALRTWEPVVAEALRCANREGSLEFRKLVRLIRDDEWLDHTMIGDRTFGAWAARLLEERGEKAEEEEEEEEEEEL
ncbi:hypothetical protein F4808DRAFT_464946 [Astrocystis sublimbata]|nr:hypothetical protein F4808DRAFT_464946 [Astrocystis sublimbata]